MLDELINTCESEISITDKILSKTRSTKEINKLQKRESILARQIRSSKVFKIFCRINRR